MTWTTAHIVTAMSLLLGHPSTDDADRWIDVAHAIEAVATEQVARGWIGTHASLSAALVVVVAGESRLDRRVHSGERRGAGGDICIAQIHPGSKRLVEQMGLTFEGLAGVDREATERCLRVAARLLAFGASKCQRAPNNYRRNWAPAMFTHYATGHKCWLSRKAWQRGRQLHWLLGKVGR